jgi:cell division septation protein DedD
MFFGEKEETISEVKSVAIPFAPEQNALEEKLQPAVSERVQQESKVDQQESVVKLDKIDQITESIEANNIIQEALDTSIAIEQPVVKKEVKPDVKKAPQKKAEVSKQTNQQKVVVKTQKISVPQLSESHTLRESRPLEVGSTAQLKKAQAANQAWVIQLGSFNQAQNANAFIKQLRDKGFQAFGYSRVQAGQVVNRVYIGPFSKLDHAKKMREQLLAMNIDNFITQFNPVDID